MYYLNDLFLILTNMDNNSKFLLSMIALIIVLLIIIIIISAVSKSKEEQRIKALKQVPTDKASIKDKLEKLNFQFEDKKEEKIVPIKEEKVPEPLEVLEPEEEIEIIEVEDNDIENIAKEIETSKPRDFNLNEFEREQEESAIISYDELVKKAGAKKIIYKKEEKEPVKQIKKEESGFKPSQIVSPIYGIQDKTNYVKKSTLTREEKYESLSTSDNEMIEDIEFLNKLKKFRRELE